MNECRKVIYIWNTPFGNRDYHRLGVDYLEKQGYNVEIWRIINDNSVRVLFSAGMYAGNNYFEYYMDEYEKRVEKCGRETVFIFYQINQYIIPVAQARHQYIIMCGLAPTFWPKGDLFSKLSKTKEKAIESLPVRLRKGLAFFLFSSINRGRIKKINGKINKLIKLAPPRIVISSTRSASREYVPEQLHDMVITTHAMDYDRFIEVNRYSTNSEKKHIVYCDSGLFHTGLDGIMSSRDMGQTYEQEYYAQLNNLFQILEDYYQIPVVIAGHPHVVYDNNAFCGRSIYFDKTCELTKNATLFVTTNSTATSFALLYDTPILKIANQKMRLVDGFGLDTYELIKYEAEVLLECGFLNMDNEEEMKSPWKHIKATNANKRKEYINKYIIDNDTTKQTIIEYLEEQLQGL